MVQHKKGRCVNISDVSLLVSYSQAVEQKAAFGSQHVL